MAHKVTENNSSYSQSLENTNSFSGDTTCILHVCLRIHLWSEENLEIMKVVVNAFL